MTLIELMAAMGVIAIALFSILVMILYVVRTKETQKELSHAKQVATARLEQVKSVTYPTGTPLPYSTYVVQQITGTLPLGTTTTWTFSVPGLADPGTVDKLGRGTMTFITLNPDVIDVSVNIQWSGAGRTNSNYLVRSVFSKGY